MSITEFINCPQCKGKDLWGNDGHPMSCELCGLSKKVTIEKAIVYLIRKVDNLEKNIAEVDGIELKY